MRTLQIIVPVAVLIVTALAAGAATEKPAKPKPELPKTGVNLPRPTGGWINAEAVGIRFVIKFFDQENEPMPPVVERGFARFRYAGKRPERAVLNVEGTTLVTPATVRPPHNFFVILNLFPPGTEESETHTFNYP